MRRVPRSLLLLALTIPAIAADRYQITLRLPPDGLYAGEEMQIEFRIVDTTRPDPLVGFVPVIRAAPEAEIDMPEMPAMPRFRETAHAEGTPGDYGIHPTFAHGGEFRLRLSVTPPGGEPFTKEFPLHVLDANTAARRKPLPPRYSMELAAQPKKPKAGERVELRFTVRDRDTGNGAVTGFEIVHEAPMHLIVVRRDLSRFQHEHPKLEPDGTFRVALTLDAGGDYRLFADIAPKGAGSQVLLAKLSVSGPEGAGFEARKVWTGESAQTLHAGGCSLALTGNSFPARKTVPLTFTLTDSASGATPAGLEPYLGAMGHLLLIHEDAVTFVHSHPGDSPAGVLNFLARFPKPGIYRGWVQFQRNGQVATADLLLRAGAGE